jgi:hypothetical protein
MRVLVQGECADSPAVQYATLYATFIPQKEKKKINKCFFLKSQRCITKKKHFATGHKSSHIGGLVNNKYRHVVHTLAAATCTRGE